MRDATTDENRVSVHTPTRRPTRRPRQHVRRDNRRDDARRKCNGFENDRVACHARVRRRAGMCWQ